MLVACCATGFFSLLHAQLPTIQFSTSGGHTMIQQVNSLGQVVKVLENGEYNPGTYNIDVYSDGLPSGAYFIRLQNKSLQKVINVIKLK